jgi:hypothetical protein
LNYSLVSLAPSSQFNCNGWIWASVPLGFNPINYFWSTGSPTTDFAIQNLCNDFYSLTIVDDNGCGADTTILLSDSIVQIQLPKDTLTINEVVIRAYWDYKTMKQIVINMQPIDLSQFYPDWDGTELLYLEPHPMSFNGPIQALYDAFNQSARLQRKLIRNRKEYNQVMNMMGRYLDTIPAKPEHMQELPD